MNAAARNNALHFYRRAEKDAESQPLRVCAKALGRRKCTEASSWLMLGFALPHCLQTQQVASSIQKEYACVITKSFC